MTAPRYTITPMDGAKLDSEGEWMRASEVLEEKRKPVLVSVSATFDRQTGLSASCDVQVVVGGRLWDGGADVGYRRHEHACDWLSQTLLDCVEAHPKLSLDRLIEAACCAAIAACES